MTVAQIGTLNSFTASTTIVSADVNSNFTDIKTAFNALVTASDQLAGGISVNGALTVVSGGLTVTAGGLTVTAGGATITAGGLTVTAGVIVGANGGGSAPTYGFSNDADTGMYMVSEGILGFTSAGTTGFTLNGSTEATLVPPLTLSGAIRQSTDTTYQAIYGGTGTTGCRLLLFGPSHATLAYDFSFTGGSYVAQSWDDSSGMMYFCNQAIKFTVNGGIQVGAPTGNDKGAGTINVAGDIYKNNSAYGNPDYVFEVAYDGDRTTAPKEYPGLPTLAEVQDYVRREKHLPRISRDASGIFGRADMVLEKVEEIYLYLMDHETRLERLGG